MLIATEGEGTMRAEGKEYKLSEGYIFFVAHGFPIEFQAQKGLQVLTSFIE